MRETNFEEVAKSWEPGRDTPLYLLFITGMYHIRVTQISIESGYTYVAGETVTGERLSFTVSPALYPLFDFPLERPGIVDGDFLKYDQYGFVVRFGHGQVLRDILPAEDKHTLARRVMTPKAIYESYLSEYPYQFLDLRNSLLLRLVVVSSKATPGMDDFGRLRKSYVGPRYALESVRSNTQYAISENYNMGNLVMVDPKDFEVGTEKDGQVVKALGGGASLLMHDSTGPKCFLPIAAAINRIYGPYVDYDAKVERLWAKGKIDYKDVRRRPLP